MFTKIGNENYKMIVMKVSINAVSFKVIERCELKTIPPLHPYKDKIRCYVVMVTMSDYSR